jgi:hypothetical protein
MPRDHNPTTVSFVSIVDVSLVQLPLSNDARCLVPTKRRTHLPNVSTLERGQCHRSKQRSSFCLRAVMAAEMATSHLRPRAN